MSCTAYQPAPLDPERMLTAMREEGAGPRLANLAALELRLVERNRQVVEARAALGEALAHVDAGVPWPNPSLEGGPVFLAGGGIAGSASRGVEAALGWAVRLSGAGALLEDLDAAEAEARALDLAAVVRSEVLALRQDLVAAAFAGERARLAERQVAVATAALALQDRMRDGGRATALDRERAALSVERAKVRRAAAAADAVRARSDVAARCGIGLARVPEVDRSMLPQVPKSVLEEFRGGASTLWDGLLEAPELVALHGAHRAAEARLRWEVRRQYPDLNIGLGFEREDRVNRYVVPFGIEVPLFDRNQRGIATAEAERNAARQRYIAALRERGAALEGAVAALALREEQWHEAGKALGSRLDALRELAERAEAAQTLSGPDVLDLERDLLDAEQQRLDAEEERFEAWMELEARWGAPIVGFPVPGEPADGAAATDTHEGDK